MKTKKYCQYLCSSIFYITLLFLALFLLFLVAYWHEIVQPQKIILTEHRGEEIHDFPESNKCQNLEKTSCKTDVWSVSVTLSMLWKSDYKKFLDTSLIKVFCQKLGFYLTIWCLQFQDLWINLLDSSIYPNILTVKVMGVRL